MSVREASRALRLARNAAIAAERERWVRQLLDLGEDLQSDGLPEAAKRVFALVEART